MYLIGLIGVTYQHIQYPNIHPTSITSSFLTQRPVQSKIVDPFAPAQPKRSQQAIAELNPPSRDKYMPKPLGSCIIILLQVCDYIL